MNRPLTVLLVALAAAATARADDAEDKAVAFVEKLGGVVTRDEKQPGKPVVAVTLVGRPVTDAALKELAAIGRLTDLDLDDTRATAAGVSRARSAPLTGG